MRVAAILALNLPLILMPGLSFAQTAAPSASLTRSVSVSGACLRSAQPDRGSISVTATFQEADLQKAAKKATEAYEKLKASVQKLGLKDIELGTSEYDLSEVREWEKDRQVFKGFRARMGLRVTTSETSRLGEVIALAANQGLREVGGLNLFLSDAKLKEEKESCLEDAVKNARTKADRIAKAAGARLGRVLIVNENAVQPAPIQPMMKTMQMRGSAEVAQDVSAPTVDAEASKIAVSVDVMFALD